MSVPTWIVRGNFLELKAEQRSEEWRKARKFRLTASITESLFGLSRFATKRETIDKVLGITGQTPPNEAMLKGIEMEPVLRKEHEERLNIKITEPSLCIGIKIPNIRLFWRSDQKKIFDVYPDGMRNPLHPNWFIGGSPDGEIYLPKGYEGNLEIKYAQNMYLPLLRRLSDIMQTNGLPPPMYRERVVNGLLGRDNFGHIWYSHFLQMQQCMGICNRSFCDYVVGADDADTYVERVPFDETFWTDFLYPNLVYIVETEIKPKMSVSDKEEFIKGVINYRGV